MVTEESIGVLIKNRRHQLGFSLRELARITGLTASFLSQVECGRANTSINSLRNIAEALSVPMLYFLAERAEHSPVVRADKRLKLILPDSEASYELLMPDIARKMEAICGRIKPGSGNVARPLRESTEEFIFVLSGKLCVELDTGEYLLNPGDSIYFEGFSLKGLSCASGDENEEVHWISVITPPVFFFFLIMSIPKFKGEKKI